MNPPPSGNPELISEIRREIENSGPMTFARFMALALYHETLGYYNSSPEIIGRGGDYYTSVSLGPMFGRLLAVQIEEIWRLLGSPAPFTIAECGAGTGMLCTDILSFLRDNHPECFAASRYMIFEISSVLKEQQRQVTAEAGFSEKTSWGDFDGTDTGPFTGVIISNELIDAFPTHQVVMDGDTLKENFVYIAGDDGFEIRPGPVSDPQLSAYLDAAGAQLAPGQIAEICLGALSWIRRATELLSSGVIITIDYGFTAPKLYGPARPRGTLMCYSRHTAGEDPFNLIGLQDMTTHVNFSALISEGEAAGLRSAGLTNQAFFLVNLGLPQMAAEPPSPGTSPQQILNRNFSIKKLIDPDGLGRFGVLIQYKGFAEKPALSGLKMLP